MTTTSPSPLTKEYHSSPQSQDPVTPNHMFSPHRSRFKQSPGHTPKTAKKALFTIDHPFSQQGGHLSTPKTIRPQKPKMTPSKKKELRLLKRVHYALTLRIKLEQSLKQLAVMQQAITCFEQTITEAQLRKLCENAKTALEKIAAEEREQQKRGSSLNLQQQVVKEQLLKLCQSLEEITNYYDKYHALYEKCKGSVGHLNKELFHSETRNSDLTSLSLETAEQIKEAAEERLEELNPSSIPYFNKLQAQQITLDFSKPQTENAEDETQRVMSIFSNLKL